MSDNPPNVPPGEQPTYPGQQPYAGQQQPYGQQPYQQGPQWGTPRPKHPKATTALVLGILSLVVCGVLAPFAWVIGGRAVAEIDANPGAYEGRGEAQAGRILGIIGTVLLIVGVLAFAAIFTLIVVAGLGSTTSSDYSELSLISLI